MRTCRIHPKTTGSPWIPPGSTPGSTLTAIPKSIVNEPTDTRNGAPTDWPAQRTDLTSHRRIHRPSNPTERTTEQAARPTDQPERAPRASTRTQTDRLTERSTDRPARGPTRRFPTQCVLQWLGYVEASLSPRLPLTGAEEVRHSYARASSESLASITFLAANLSCQALFFNRLISR